jgi:hypothetical protein
LAERPIELEAAEDGAANPVVEKGLAITEGQVEIGASPVDEAVSKT